MASGDNENSKKNLKKFSKKFQPKDEEGNPTNGRPKGSENRSTVIKKWLSAKVTRVNPETGLEEKMTLLDSMVLSLSHKVVSNKDTSAFRALMDYSWGQARETIDVNQIAEQPLFEDVPKDDSDKENTDAKEED
tara:strand:+ start:2867 stop:3268 length:402 start_codon:yes stop_codon:yes gene_type:complete